MKVQYGTVGTRDVDVAAWNAKLDRAIAALARSEPPKAARPSGAEKMIAALNAYIAQAHHDVSGADFGAGWSAALAAEPVSARPAAEPTDLSAMSAALSTYMDEADRHGHQVSGTDFGAGYRAGWRAALSLPSSPEPSGLPESGASAPSGSSTPSGLA